MCIGGGGRDPAVDAELAKQKEQQAEMDRVADMRRRESRDLLTESLISRSRFVGAGASRQTALFSGMKSTSLLGSALTSRGGSGRASLISGSSGGSGFISGYLK